MPTRTAIARETARIVGAVLGVAIAAAMITAATVAPVPSITTVPPSMKVTPVPASQQRTCPGPLMTLASNSAAATQASSFALAANTVGASGAPVATAFLGAPDNAAGQRFGMPLVASVDSPRGSRTPPLIAASQSQTAAQEDMAGYAAANCTEANSDSWLVAGATTLGESSFVLLSNPTAVPATVNLSIFAESGPLSAPGATGILVAPGTQRVIPLAGLAPSVAAPVVHVQSTGGAVAASIEQSAVQGVTPRGVEIAGPTSAPATQQVITGVDVRTLTALQAVQSSEGYGADLPAVRVLVPGTKAANVTVGVQGESGTAMGNSYSATVKPGIVTEIPLQKLTDGYFTVTVSSNQPVVAAARTSTITGSSVDFAWFAASDPLAASALVAVPDNPGALLHVANPTAAPMTVKVTQGAAVQTMVVPASGATHLPLGATGTYRLDGVAGLRASVSFEGDAQLAAFTLEPAAAFAAAVPVYAK